MKLQKNNLFRKRSESNCSGDPDILMARVEKQFRKTGKPGIFLLEMPVFESGSDMAARIADFFFGQSILRGREVHSISLLTLLSSSLSMDQLVSLIARGAKENSGVILIDDLHRYFYHEQKTRMLLRRLVRLWSMSFSGTPLILKAPADTLRHLMLQCPELQSCAFRITADS